MAISLREIFARFGVSFDSSELKKGNKETNEAVKSLQSLAKQFTAPALVIGAAHFVKSMVEGGIALNTMARQMHTSATSLREWQFVAEANGLQAEEMSAALGTLAKNSRDATQGNYDMAYTFRRLHVDVRDSNGQLKDTGSLMTEVSSALARVERPALRARLTMQLLGESGRYITPLFENGAASVENLRAEVRELVGGDIEEFSAQSKEAQRTTARAKLAFEALATSLTLVMLPTITRGVSIIAGAVRWFKEWADKSYILQATITVAAVVIAAALLKMGVAAAIAFAPAIIAAAPFVLALVAITLAVDDLIALFSGGKSVVGDWLDELLGVGESRGVVQAVREAWEDLIGTVEHAIETVTEFFGIGREQNIGRLGRPRIGGREVTPRGPAVTRDSINRQQGFVSQATTPNQNRVMADYFGGPGVIAGTVNESGQVITPRSVSSNSVRSPGANVTVQSSVGQIVVQSNATDPTAVAEEVHGRLVERQRESFAAARRALAPVVRSRGQ